MPTLETSEIAKLLLEFGQRTAFRGGNPYRSRAYLRAAENLLAVPEPLETLVAQNRLKEIPGIGNAIAEIVIKLHQTGGHPTLEAMRKEIPSGALELLAVPGLRPEKALKLHQELGISSLEELEAAAKSDRLRPVKGLGAALQKKILQAIEVRREAKGRRHVHRADLLLRAAAEQLRRSSAVLTRISPAGDFRRGCELIGKLSIVGQKPAGNDAPVIRGGGPELTVHVADEKHYGAALLMATGSEAHIDELRRRAARRGMTLDEAGLRKGGKLIAGRSEDEIYKALRLPCIAPELREGRGEIEKALKGKLPKLVTDDDIRGILHAHTDKSDGVDTLDAMVEAVRSRGYEYFGVADHSQSARYAGGLSLEEIGEQHAAIDRLNQQYENSFRIFKGIESDILADGSLDYPDDVLARFDFVIASVHGRFRLDRDAQTARILRAVANPFTTVLGHMTGRQLLRRPGYDVDIERILEACATHGVAVEINANPWRLDLDWRWHQRALELGCMMSINPDAHSTDEIDLTHWGVQIARKGGVPRDRVLNCLDLPAFEAHLAARSVRHVARSSVPDLNAFHSVVGR
jgi:DNA polymerase (family X)